MLIYIQNMLPYPRSGVANIIYQITDTVLLRKFVKYNPELDQFEIPISVLTENGIDCNIDCWDCRIEGTPIHYGTDYHNNFCFRIE